MRHRSLGIADVAREEQGFSLVETLISSAILLGVALSTASMFTQSMMSNETGRSSTEISNILRGHLERLGELPFASDELTLVEGTERVSEEYFSRVTKSWHAGPAPAGTPSVQWERTTTVRQYGLAALADGVLDTAEALSTDALPQTVHMKEIEVAIDQTGVLWGPAKRIRVRTLKVK